MEKKKDKILIVDDEKDFREVLCEFLDGKGYDVVGAQNGKDAMKRIESNEFQIIFMDVKLPDTNGTEVYKAMKQIDTKAKVVMMTGYLHEPLAEEDIESNFRGYLHKPFGMKKFLTTIEQILEEGNKYN